MIVRVRPDPDFRFKETWDIHVKRRFLFWTWWEWVTCHLSKEEAIDAARRYLGSEDVLISSEKT